MDVIHLHHGVWLIHGAPTFAAGEEKTSMQAPPGYGWRYRTSDQWVMNHMIHNLTPNATDVYIDYEIEFTPDTAPEAASAPSWIGCAPRISGRRSSRRRARISRSDGKTCWWLPFGSRSTD